MSHDEHHLRILSTLHFDRRTLPPCLAMAVIVPLATLQLHWQGRAWWCSCYGLNPWAGDIWSQHNSQHLLDPYSLTHVLHGVVLFWLLALTMPRMPLLWRLFTAIVLEALWEVVENSEFIIQRYREATLALGYNGDSIVNSLGDILCCALGVLLARRLGFRLSLVLFVVTELLLLAWIRDNLTLNVLMLVHPVESIKAWQMTR